jgi:3-deoxy-D-manno-octulosonic-acid transferase
MKSPIRSPWQLKLYRIATRLAQPAAGLILGHRLKKGKEDAARLGERKAVPGRSRPPGPLVWIHGASVGETVSMTPIVERLMARGYTLLVTSGTLTSARVMAERLPTAAIHQFIPLDTPGFMRRFFCHWRPDVGLIAESELWPNMIVEAGKAGLPLMLLNGRMSDKSYQRWSKQESFARVLLGRFDVIMAQSQRDGERFSRLGAPRITLGGNLKYDVLPPPADLASLALLEGATGGRPIWIAASTHPGEAADHHRAAPPAPRPGDRDAGPADGRVGGAPLRRLGAGQGCRCLRCRHGR